MDFTFTEEQNMIRESAREALADYSSSARVRAAMTSEAGYEPEVWQSVCGELGWSGVHIPEAWGGHGMGYVELAILFEEMGRSLLCAPFISSIALAANTLLVAGSDAQREACLPLLASGGLLATLAGVGAGGRWSPDAIEPVWRKGPDGYELSGTASHVLWGHVSELLVVAAREEGSRGTDGVALFLVPADSERVSIRRLPTLDQTRPLADIQLDGVKADGDAALGTPGEAWPDLEKILQLAAVALAAEQAGGAQQCLDLAVAYTTERVQFGRPVGSFQAVKHKCADMMVKAESAVSAVYYAACVADEALAGGELGAELPEAASLAQAYCSEALFHCAGECIQLHGGVGFTWEYDPHLYFKRAKSAETLLGTPAWHRERLAGLIGL